MNKILNSLSALMMLMILGCTTSTEERVIREARSKKFDDVSKISATDLLENVRKSIDPTSMVNSAQTIKAVVFSSTLKKDTTDRLIRKYDFLFQKNDPTIYKLELKTINTNTSSRDESMVEVLINNGKLKVVENSNSDSASSIKDVKKLNKLKEMALDFRVNLFFGIFDKPLSLKLDKRTYMVDEQNCYKLEIVLKNNYSEFNNVHSQSIQFYIDEDSYLIRKIETNFSEITNIKYENFGGVNMIEKYQVNDPYYNSKVIYVLLEELKFNEKVDSVQFMEELKGQSI